MSELEELKALRKEAQALEFNIERTFTDMHGYIISGPRQEVVTLMNKLYHINEFIDLAIDALEGKL